MNGKIMLLNGYRGGYCRCIKSQYFKSSVANFLLQTTRGASAVIVEYDL